MQSDVDVDVRKKSKGILGFGRKTSKSLNEGRGSGEKVAQQAKTCALLNVGSAAVAVAAAAAANNYVKQLRLCLCPPASSTFFCRHPR